MAMVLSAKKWLASNGEVYRTMYFFFSIKYRPPAGKTVYLNKVINIFEDTSLCLIIILGTKHPKRPNKVVHSDKALLSFQGCL